MEIAAQIEELESQLRRLKDRHLLELRMKLAEAKGVVVLLEEQLRELHDIAGLRPVVAVADCRKPIAAPARQDVALCPAGNVSQNSLESAPNGYFSPQCHRAPSENSNSSLPGNKTPDRPAGVGMLVLGRRASETIMIGDNIEIMVGRIERYQVQLRISEWNGIRGSKSEVNSSEEPFRRFGLLGRVGQPLIISNNIEVVVSRIDRGYEPEADQARIRIFAPREIRIFRGELYREIKRDGFEATNL